MSKKSQKQPLGESYMSEDSQISSQKKKKDSGNDSRSKKNAKDLDKKQAFEYSQQNDSMMMGLGGIPTDEKSTFAQQEPQKNRRTNEFFDDYSDSQKCCIWGIFGGSSRSSRRPKKSIVYQDVKQKKLKESMLPKASMASSTNGGLHQTEGRLSIVHDTRLNYRERISSV